MRAAFPAPSPPEAPEEGACERLQTPLLGATSCGDVMSSIVGPVGPLADPGGCRSADGRASIRAIRRHDRHTRIFAYLRPLRSGARSGNSGAGVLSLATSVRRYTYAAVPPSGSVAAHILAFGMLCVVDVVAPATRHVRDRPSASSVGPVFAWGAREVPKLPSGPLACWTCCAGRSMHRLSAGEDMRALSWRRPERKAVPLRRTAELRARLARLGRFTCGRADAKLERDCAVTGDAGGMTV